MKTKKEFNADASLKAQYGTYDNYLAAMNNEQTKEVVANFHPRVKALRGKRTGFLNSGISFGMGVMTCQRLFIANKEKAAGKTTADAENVYASLRIVDAEGNKLEFADQIGNVNAYCADKGKSLFGDAGEQLEVNAEIKNGIYLIAD